MTLVAGKDCIRFPIHETFLYTVFRTPYHFNQKPNGKTKEKKMQKPRLCFTCKQPGHMMRACPLNNCFNCGEPGHFFGSCPKKAITEPVQRDILTTQSPVTKKPRCDTDTPPTTTRCGSGVTRLFENSLRPTFLIVTKDLEKSNTLLVTQHDAATSPRLITHHDAATSPRLVTHQDAATSPRPRRKAHAAIPGSIAAGVLQMHETLTQVESQCNWDVESQVMA